MKMRKSWRVEVLPLQRGHRRLTWMAAKMQFLQKTWPQRVEKGSRPWTYSMHTGHLYKSEFGVAFDVSGGASVSFEHWNSAQTNFNYKSQISQGTTNHKALHQFLWAPSRLPLRTLLLRLEKLSWKKENPEECLCQFSDKSLANGDNFNWWQLQSDSLWTQFAVIQHSLVFVLSVLCI